MANGTQVTVLEKGDAWSRVSTPQGLTGYASNEYLSFFEGDGSSSGSTTTIYANVTASALYLRSGPGTGYPSITLLPNGKQVTVLEKGGAWSKVTVDGLTGYCSSEYLSFSTISSGGGTSTAYPFTAYVTASSLNIRSGPGTNYSCIGGIPYGGQISVVAQAAEGWYQITYGGVSGYVSAQYVSTTAPSTGSGSSTSGSGSGSDYTPPAGLTGTAAENIVAIAASQIGYVEGSNNDTKYGIAYGMNHQPWCHMFVWWCARQAGIYDDVIPTTAYCPYGVSWYSARGAFHYRGDGYTPRPGDLIYFDWNYNNSSDHVGIVETVVGNTVYTIEGNTSGRVARRSYALGNGTIMGYGVPSYNW